MFIQIVKKIAADLCGTDELNVHMSNFYIGELQLNTESTVLEQTRSAHEIKGLD